MGFGIESHVSILVDSFQGSMAYEHPHFFLGGGVPGFGCTATG